jgi:pimeloyl-ACP methyl ester carboxylesterase
MGRAEINGVTLDYSIAGTGEPVVFIHGAFIADAFQPLVAEPAIADRFRLITYHRRGYGESGHPPGPTSIAQQAADCRALLAHLDIERAHIVGHSFGGIVALQLALDNPEAVHSLALLEPGLMIGASAAGYREALARGSQRYREVGAARAVDEFLRARWQQYREHLDRIVPGAFAQAVADAGTWFETEASAQLAWNFGTAEAVNISQPALSVLGGESEALWERFGETHRWLLTHLPRVEGLVVPGATHLMAFQRPRETAEGIAGFFSRHLIPS